MPSQLQEALRRSEAAERRAAEAAASAAALEAQRVRVDILELQGGLAAAVGRLACLHATRPEAMARRQSPSFEI